MGGSSGSGGACPVNWTEYLTSEGKSVCVPNPTPTSGGGYSCPVDWMLFITSEGKATCIPAPTPIPGGSGNGGGGSGSGGPLSSPVLVPPHAATHTIKHQRTLITPRYRGTERVNQPTGDKSPGAGGGKIPKGRCARGVIDRRG